MLGTVFKHCLKDRRYVDGLAVVSDHDAHEARKYFWREKREIIELAASCNIAALENGLVPDITGKNVVVLICGGNDFEENLDKKYVQTPVDNPYLQVF